MNKSAEQKLAEYMAPRIKRAIKESRRTQEQTADKIGVSKVAVSKWIRTGQITMANLLLLAEATRKPMAWFFPGYSEADDAAEADAQALGDLLDEIVAAGDTELLEEALFAILSAKRDLIDS